MSKRLVLCLAGALSLAAAGCATVNIYVTFPQEKIESAAESFLMDLESHAPADGSSDRREGADGLARGFSIWRPAPLQAQTLSAELRMDSPAISRARSGMSARLNVIGRLKDEGRVGESNEGLLETVVTAGLDRAALLELRRMVEEENRDRMTVYREIVRINSMPADQLATVQKSFAAAYRRLARPGHFVQDEKGAWERKEADPKAAEN